MRTVQTDVHIKSTWGVKLGPSVNGFYYSLGDRQCCVSHELTDQGWALHTPLQLIVDISCSERSGKMIMCEDVPYGDFPSETDAATAAAANQGDNINVFSMMGSPSGRYTVKNAWGCLGLVGWKYKDSWSYESRTPTSMVAAMNHPKSEICQDNKPDIFLACESTAANSAVYKMWDTGEEVSLKRVQLPVSPFNGEQLGACTIDGTVLKPDAIHHRYNCCAGDCLSDSMPNKLYLVRADCSSYKYEDALRTRWGVDPPNVYQDSFMLEKEMAEEHIGKRRPYTVSELETGVRKCLDNPPTPYGNNARFLVRKFVQEMFG